jgi:hypothetical protein
LLEAPRSGEHNPAGSFNRSSDAPAIAELAGEVRLLLVMTTGTTAAQRLKTEVA